MHDVFVQSRDGYQHVLSAVRVAYTLFIDQ